MATTERHTNDAEELVAREALALREVLLRVHARRARREDLEDIYSVAVIELLRRARRDRTFATAAHVRAAIRQKFESRICDHHRAVAGRSTAAVVGATACPLELIADTLPSSGDTVREVLDRERLQDVIAAGRCLSADQRIALVSQLAGESPASCCARHSWSTEKYRKTLQRARARLRSQIALASGQSQGTHGSLRQAVPMALAVTEG